MAPAAVRIGIINLMPRAEVYERGLLQVLRATGVAHAPALVRLRTHAYQSSDGAHIERSYRGFGELWQEAPLAGLLITGAPVEELAFEDVTYWSELCEIIDFAREHVPSTLGLCWGGMALAQRLGIAKHNFRQKLFGVFPLRNLAPQQRSFFAGWLAQLSQ
jgi:homoserine O-succinyltransferase